MCQRANSQLTLDVRNALLQNLIENFGVLELLLDLGNDRVGQFLLLLCLDLTFVTNPRVEDGLGLGGDVGLLLELKGLGLELSGLLQTNQTCLPIVLARETYLGNSEEVLGDINHSAKILYAVDTCLDGVGVVIPCSVENSLDLVLLALRPFRVHWARIGVDRPIDCQERKCNNRLLIDDIELIADGGNG